MRIFYPNIILWYNNSMTICVAVDSFMINAGERFNFILRANQNPGCYWMRFRGLGDCGEKKSSTHQEAFICYDGFQPDVLELIKPTYDQGKRSGTVRFVELH